MKYYRTLKLLILKDQKFTNHFLEFVGAQMQNLKEESLDYTISDLMLSYCSRQMSLSRLYKTLQELDGYYLKALLEGKNYPGFGDFVNAIPKKSANKNRFTIIEGLLILQDYGSSGEEDTNKKRTAKERAEIQSKNLLKKDLNGLLGVTNLFKKNMEDKDKRNSNSVWTVKK